MMRVLEGKLVDSGIKVGIVAARFNEFIVSKLVAGAKDGLVRHDVSEKNIDLAWVPGAFEILQAITIMCVARFPKALQMFL